MAHPPMAAPQEEEVRDLVKVPVEYHDLSEVFSKARATWGCSGLFS